jgi:hypothetical protein
LCLTLFGNFFGCENRISPKNAKYFMGKLYGAGCLKRRGEGTLKKCADLTL